MRAAGDWTEIIPKGNVICLNRDYQSSSPIDPRCNTENPDSNSSGTTTSDSNQEAIAHINQAQSSLQNGDTEGAQMHMDLAKKALICNPGDPAHC